LFTGTLIEALTSGQADLDRNCIVTFSELALFLEQRVGQTSGARQTPDHGAFHLDDRGELMLAMAGCSLDQPFTGAPSLAHSQSRLPSVRCLRHFGIVRMAIVAVAAALAMGASFVSRARQVPDDTEA
jgi:hypothetical protein